MKAKNFCSVFLVLLMILTGCSSDEVAGGGRGAPDASDRDTGPGALEDVAPGDATAPDATPPGDARDPGDACRGAACEDVSPATPRCGDARVSGSEFCDDGNTESDDGCDEFCRIEPGWVCPVAGEPCQPRCGDGIVLGGEQCDDGNPRNGDGCDQNCQLEPGYTCPTPGARCQASVCGDGIRAGDEECDDGNNASGDGCSATCQIEVGFACATPGEACDFVVECGDGKIGGMELCDDGNTVSGDGCDANCQTEPGWRCQVPGEPCEAARCGDGIVAGNEECDDGNTTSGDGCSELCQLEPGFFCPTSGVDCVPTVCGNGHREGGEACDDDNNNMGDGCTPFCTLEPSCPPGGGACSSSCGDGIRLPGSPKQCEDGNTNPNDGCSPTCAVEPGWRCDDVTHDVDALHLPLVLRDFSIHHPDFETFSGSGATTGMVQDYLGADGKPVFRALQGMLTSEENFNQWYRDVPGVNYTFLQTMTLDKLPEGTFQFSNSAFFPLDGLGFGEEGLGHGHNFGFTSEVRYWFVFRPGQVLAFTGDDDLWVFINKKLALDLGGLHSPVSGSVDLDAKKVDLGLEDGKLYEIAVFQAERHSTGSTYQLTLGNFVNVTTQCSSICGDGIKTAVEECDDGVNDGRYAGCNADCTRAPYCGDGEVDPELEQCDNGVNQDLYGRDGCTPLCRRPAFCGDYRVDSLFGEECDDGINDGSYGTCNADCTLAPRCGDGIVQTEVGEECDDGNVTDGDGCSSDCKLVNG